MKAAAAFIASFAPALAGTIDDSLPDSVYLAYGQQFAPYTRRVEVVGVDGKLAIGSGCVIGDRWVLTAAHVVDNAVTISVSGNPVVTYWQHQDWESDRVGYNDIAALYCKADFGLDYYPPLATSGDTVGATVTLAGYGVTGRMAGGYTRSDGLLRAGTNTIADLERTLIVCGINSGSSPREYGIAPGDSGGPLFVGAGSEARLAGIHSFTMRAGTGPLRSRNGEESAHTRVSLFVRWIDRVRGMVR
jgi:secreted trypsin-like serine protease